MSEYYKGKRTKNIYAPGSSKPFKLSRSKIDLFLNCPRCFYIDRRLGLGQPPGFPFNLNSAVDALLKNEFDQYRALQKPHPIMEENNIEAIPFQHKELDEWRENFKGVQHYHVNTHLILTGAVDDIWVTAKSLGDAEPELIVVDYKATSKANDVNLDAPWQIGYKRQMEFYQWLLRRKGFKVSNTGYFIYANGLRSEEAFNNTLKFKTTLLPYTGNDSWVESTIKDAYKCLNAEAMPQPTEDCDFCIYYENRKTL